MTNQNVELSGKDYLTIDETAHYACVSNCQFRAKAAEYGLQPFSWMGKTVYRKVDIQAAIERVALLACGGPETVPEQAEMSRTGFALLANATAAHQQRVARRACARNRTTAARSSIAASAPQIEHVVRRFPLH